MWTRRVGGRTGCEPNAHPCCTPRQGQAGRRIDAWQDVRQVLLVLAAHRIVPPSCLGTGARPNHPPATGLHVAVIFDGPAGPIGEGSQVVVGHIPTVLPPSTS
jgi:hypothetical protein